MDFRYFIAVPKELHFAGAAERPYIEQSPLSPCRQGSRIRSRCAVVRADRPTHAPAWAGQVFVGEAQRVSFRAYKSATFGSICCRRESSDFA